MTTASKSICSPQPRTSPGQPNTGYWPCRWPRLSFPGSFLSPKFRVLGRGQSRGVLRVRAPAGRWSCLRQGEGERDGRADEVEGAPLDWCRLADLVEADVTDGDGGPGE